MGSNVSALVDALADQAALAVGALTTARTRSPLCFKGQPPALPGVNRRDVARRMVASLRSRISVQGPPPVELPPFGQCLSNILKSPDTGRVDRSTTVRSYDRSKLNVVSDDHTAVPLFPLLDETT